MNLNPFAAVRRRRAQEDEALTTVLQRKRFLREDVTVFGEQLSELHVDTLTDTLDDDARDYYRYALESYDRAKRDLETATTVADLDAVAQDVVEGRHQRACVLALAAGEPTPARRAECFFNPQHGPSHTEVTWTPPGGVAREVAVCRSDAQRLARGEAPAMRLVRVGDRYVPMVLARDSDDDFFPPPIDRLAVVDARRDARGDAELWGMIPGPGKDSTSGYGGM